MSLNTLNNLCLEAHARARTAGWWEEGKQKTPLEAHMLMVSEIAEATEEVRNRKPALYFVATLKPDMAGYSPDRPQEVSFVPTNVTPEAIKYILGVAMEQGFTLADLKPEGEAVELMDAFIRIADWFAWKSWDAEAVVQAKMEFNATRAYRHGGKAA